MQHTAYQQQIAGPVVIDRVETMLVDLPTIRPHKLSMAVMNGQTLMLVRIRCSDGTVGIGEGTTIGGLADGVIAKHPADVEDNLTARRIATQARVLSRTASEPTTIIVTAHHSDH